MCRKPLSHNRCGARSAIAATAWEQSAFRAGPLTASLPAVTVAEPVVGWLLGVTVLGETLQTNDAGLVALGIDRRDGGGDGSSGPLPGRRRPDG